MALERYLQRYSVTSVSHGDASMHAGDLTVVRLWWVQLR